MYARYKEIAIKAMFYEIEEKIAEKKLENVIEIYKYFNSISESFKRCFYKSYGSYGNSDIDFVSIVFF